MKLPANTHILEQLAIHRANVDRQHKARLIAERFDMERRQRELIRPVSRWRWLRRLLFSW